jgi:enoyl-CoA hydratase/carnithine racemase
MARRRLTPEEALGWRWINRVTTPERLTAEVTQLAEELAAKPWVPLAVTKDHINAIMHVMSAGTTSYADGESHDRNGDRTRSAGSGYSEG